MSRWEITEKQREQIQATGRLTLTPEQVEASFADSFVTMAFDYGLQYYGAARFAMASGFMPVQATLLHHAVEMFLQGCLALKDSPEEIHKYYQTYFSHRLPALWADLKKHFPSADLDEFDDTIKSLERFGEIRFPESVAYKGASMQMGFGDVSGLQSTDPRDFRIGAPQIDALILKLFRVADMNPRFFDWRLKNKHAEPYFTMHNSAPLT